jgi:PPOX class probable F420-dependent enzyme
MAVRRAAPMLDSKEVVDMTTSEKPAAFASLDGKRYLSITTFRQDGSPASTPVWFVSDDLDRRVVVATGAKTWKVRRIRRDPHVRVAACTASGKVTGEPIDGLARFVEEEELVRRLQAEKYGWQKTLVEKAYDLSRWATQKPAEKGVFIEIVPRTEPAPRQESLAA